MYKKLYVFLAVQLSLFDNSKNNEFKLESDNNSSNKILLTWLCNENTLRASSGK